ncbi:hypothetical protein M8J76_002300 [Diaphorina citri]|nr:hypothetical protein M8J75_011648 [Diaphorina citri]KAI5740271.1 hypothetical protein M8J76_002300 [Diaphorina citri]KAI5746335.1 hypothetical protein M8J77_002475 [Diaphorina citri]
MFSKAVLSFFFLAVVMAVVSSATVPKAVEPAPAASEALEKSADLEKAESAYAYGGYPYAYGAYGYPYSYGYGYGYPYYAKSYYYPSYYAYSPYSYYPKYPYYH